MRTSITCAAALLIGLFGLPSVPGEFAVGAADLHSKNVVSVLQEPAGLNAEISGPERDGCCTPAFSPGDSVWLLVDSPWGYAGLVAGMHGVIVCCDYDDPVLPILVSWDGWTGGHEQTVFCESSVFPHPHNSCLWVMCLQVGAEGACCQVTGDCALTAEAFCSGTWQGAGTVCTPNPCPQPTGACCVHDGSCSVTTEADCTGTWQGMDTVCTPNPCPQPTGACCVHDGSCSVTTEADCTGTWQGMDTVCTPNPCPQPTGACCEADGSCSVTAQAACTGTWQGMDTVCTPNPCPQPTGGCCLPGGGCQIMTAADCDAAQGALVGDCDACLVRPCDDLDADDVCDPNDLCPNTPAGEEVDANGCSCSQLDSDGDGMNDCDDPCPDTSGCVCCERWPFDLCPLCAAGLTGLTLVGLVFSRCHRRPG